MRRKLLPIGIVQLPDWPLQDQGYWRAAIATGHILDGRGPLADCSELRVMVLKMAYGRWLGHLRSTMPDMDIKSGLDHFDRETVAAFMGRLIASVSPGTASAYLANLQRTVAAMAPDKKVPALKGAARHVRRLQKPAPARRSGFAPSADLAALGFDEMESSKQARTPVEARIRYRNGLAIAMLAHRPIRLGNFVSIEVDRHLVLRGSEYWLYFPAQEVTNRRPLEFPLPRILNASLEHYLDEIRPQLLAGTGKREVRRSERLWIARNGTPLSDIWLRDCIRQVTSKRFGYPINPGMFRYAAARTIAIEHPEQAEILIALLGYTTFRAVDRYYSEIGMIHTARRYQSLLLEYSSDKRDDTETVKAESG